MTWVALDTATDRATAAADAGGRVGWAARDGARQHARALPGLVDQALAAAGGGLASVRGVIVADGPGSFTGLRVGAAVGKALARAAGVELWTAPSLLARAWGSAPRDGRVVLVLADALRGELYAAAWRLRAERVEAVIAPTVLTPEQVRERAASAALVVAGAPDALVAAAVPEGAAVVASGREALPDARALLALRDVAGGLRRVTDVGAWEPDYGRPAEAQARWEAAHGRALAHPAGTSR